MPIARRLLRRPNALQPALRLVRRWQRLTHSQPIYYDDNLPEASSAHHSDLATFLEYARRSGLNSHSTVYVGTHYEYTVAAALARQGFSLRRVGGSSDYGTDLVGTWALPSFPWPMRVLLQCKAGVQRVGPHHVRELEGAFIGAPVGWRGDGVLGVLVCERPATRGIRYSLSRSRWPMAFLCCSRNGELSQLLWNRRAQEEGLEGLGVAVRHAPESSTAPELFFTCNGVAVERSDDDGDASVLQLEEAVDGSSI
ncbi:hypothetical protein XA68_15251 [Ophiocordyceps unilateralis]|uniref:Restriction endonuclease type IV Mrr domain-containing protein n=1 Tax=Ophiocordyceps unilateralis TaxID=268505 RepID=A0A2A9P8R9_OPHUN|nr:hypothetical protein XA68_15251 [Ophiocordyceps unilateralis]